MSTALVGVSTDTDNSRHATSNPHRPLRHCPRSTALAAHCPPTPRPRPCPTSPAPYQPALQQQSPTVTNSHKQSQQPCSREHFTARPPARPPARLPSSRQRRADRPTVVPNRAWLIYSPYRPIHTEYTVTVWTLQRPWSCMRAALCSDATFRPAEQRRSSGRPAQPARPAQCSNFSCSIMTRRTLFPASKLRILLLPPDYCTTLPA